ncbi:MAG: OsmC family protein [Deltaproteobacteria bacterium]|nr:OsmC family protein [Deltaproteobacteria bacterium]
MHIQTKYQGNFRFASGDGDGAVTIDGAKEMGGLGIAPTPKSLLLYGLAGCTGLDIVTILQKKKVEYDSFEIDIKAEQTNTHPKIFKTIEIIFKFAGKEEDRQTIEKAIKLSEKQFCGVTAMLSKSARITWTLEIL